jgi:ABC-type Fe3+ transport system substrate-binding protein
MRRLLAGAWVILGLLGGAATDAPAATKEVAIVTSFPKELFETFKKAFEARPGGVRVVIRPMQTNAGVTYVRETRARPEADLFWASAVDAFAALKAEGLLEKHALPREVAARIPATIGAFPIHDPDGHYFGFAISGYGFMWNKPYLQAHRLTPPREWTDLADPRYFGHLAISAPSRSGTTHLTIEVILQAYGWEKGWGLLLNAGGSMGTITERSFGVPEAVISGQYGIGIVVDFFGLSAIASGNPVDFAYPSLTSVVPANIGLIRGGPNAENGRAFIHYLLSEEGQLALFQPQVGRLPVIPELYARGPQGYPNPFTMKLGGVTFNDKLSSSRRNVVNALFDQIITFRHAELKAAWGAIYKAEEAIARAKGSPREAAAASLVQEARALASRVPLDEKRARDRATNEAFKGKGDLKSRLEAEWDTAAKASYARARELAEKALAAAR